MTAADEPIRVVAYDEDWPRRFEQERAALEEAIGAWATGGLHHVGSTAVPGLEAKSIIDILAGVESLESSRACSRPLAEIGYLYAPYREHEMHWFCKPNPMPRQPLSSVCSISLASSRYCGQEAIDRGNSLAY